MLFKKFYAAFSSLKTSVWILSAMSFLYMLGTVFPQGGEVKEYVSAGGRYVSIVKAFSLLHIFTSPLFLFLVVVLSVNLLTCIYERFKSMKSKAGILSAELLMNNPGLIELCPEEKKDAIFKKLKGMRFGYIETGSGYYVFGKGLPYWWLSWIYHLGIVVAILGFLTTALLSFENEITLFRDAPEKISLYSPDTRLNKYLMKSGIHVPSRDKSGEYHLALKDFKTEYYQSLKFEYPKEKPARFAIGVGLKSIEPAKEAGLSPKMWITELELKTPGNKIIDASLWVNHPFRYRGLTLYQMGFEQKMKLVAAGKTAEVKSMEPFNIPGIKGKFTASIIKTGRIFRKDGTEGNIKPFFDLSYISEKGTKEKLGEIYLNKSKNIKGVPVLFRNLKEGSSLSYRVDPGVPLIETSILLVFLGLFFRSLGYWYRVYIIIKNGKLYALMSTRGLFANKDRVLKNLRRA